MSPDVPAWYGWIILPFPPPSATSVAGTLSLEPLPSTTVCRLGRANSSGSLLRQASVRLSLAGQSRKM